MVVVSNLNKTFAAYLGPNTTEHASGFIIEGNFFAVFEINKSDAINQLYLFTEEARDCFKQEFPLTDTDLQKLCEELINKHQPTSLAVGYLHHNQIFTFSQGASLLLLRQNNLFSASQNNLGITGEIKNADTFFYLTPNLIEPLKEVLKTKNLRPKELIEKIKQNFSQEPGALLAVETTLEKSVEKSFKEPLEEITKPTTTSSFLANPLLKKRLKIGVLAIVLIVIIYQVFALAKNSLKNSRQQKLQEKISIIESKYQKLQKQLQQNPTQAISEIKLLTEEVSELSQQYSQQKTELKPLEKKLNSLKQTYGQAKISNEKVFYDLTLISQKARADYLKLSAEYIAILDNQNQKAYLISIDNKNVEEFSYEGFKKAQLAGEYNKSLYVYSQNNGVYKSQENKLKKIINYQKGWGEIIDLEVFNSNLYLLSRSKDEIYKFTPAAEGYSSKISYFQSGQSQDLSDINSMAIDFSVYLLGNAVYKYTAGERDGYKTLSELDYSSFRRIFKTEQTNYVYLLDNQNSRIVVLNEEGRLIKSIFNPKLGNSQYFGVYQDEMIIFLYQNKLYKLDNF